MAAILQPDNRGIPQAPIVSVIIPVYKGEKYLGETIRSVMEQSDSRWEIIAVNDGSPDNSLQVLESFQPQLGDRIRIISVKNGGVSRARNIGAAAAAGKYLAFVDQDDLFAPEKLEDQIHILESDPDLVLCYTNESVINDQGKTLHENILSLSSRNRGNIFEELLFDNFIPISSVVMPKAVFESIGGFNPYYTLAEDYDLLLKVADTGEIDFINKPLLKYRLHKESNTFTRIDRIMNESFAILDSWIARRPELYKRNRFRYALFKIKFYYLKMKVRLTPGF